MKGRQPGPRRARELREAISLAMHKSNDLHSTRVQRNAIHEKMTSLTEQERQVLKLFAKGDLNKQVAMALNVSQRTVERRRQQIMIKLGVESFAELVRLIVESEERRED